MDQLSVYYVRTMHGLYKTIIFSIALWSDEFVGSHSRDCHPMPAIIHLNLFFQVECLSITAGTLPHVTKE